MSSHSPRTKDEVESARPICHVILVGWSTPCQPTSIVRCTNTDEQAESNGGSRGEKNLQLGDVEALAAEYWPLVE